MKKQKKEEKLYISLNKEYSLEEYYEIKKLLKNFLPSYYLKNIYLYINEQNIDTKWILSINVLYKKIKEKEVY